MPQRTVHRDARVVALRDTVRMVLSGYTDLATVTDAINRGSIYRFLTKPWEDDELRAHIREEFRTHDATHGTVRG
jgi:ActR/RegA family two-component response regulator